MNNVTDFVLSIQRKGVKLWVENGQLHCRAPKGALTEDETKVLRAKREQIVALYNGTEQRSPALCLAEDTAPLTYSQIAYWDRHRISDAGGSRNIATTMSLHGKVDVNAVMKSIAEIIRRHDALRTRIVTEGGVPVQKVSRSLGCDLQQHDLTSLQDGSRAVEIVRQLDELVSYRSEISVSSPLGVRLLRVRPDECIFIVAIEHMISDAWSLSNFLNELFVLYEQLIKGQEPLLPEIRCQFPAYASWQANMRESWIERHGGYWAERLRGSQCVKFPDDRGPSVILPGWATVPIEIGTDLKKKLVWRSREMATTLAMSLLTAYAGLVMRWCDVSDLVLPCLSDGRGDPDTQNAIGFFASRIYLRIESSIGDTFVDLLKQVTEEYCRAVEHDDFGYVDAHATRSEFSRNSHFNWIPARNNCDRPSSPVWRTSEFTVRNIDFENPWLKDLQWKSEPTVLLQDRNSEITGAIFFPRDRFRIETMSKFSRTFLTFIQEFAVRPRTRVMDITLDIT